MIISPLHPFSFSTPLLRLSELNKIEFHFTWRGRLEVVSNPWTTSPIRRESLSVLSFHVSLIDLCLKSYVFTMVTHCSFYQLIRVEVCKEMTLKYER